MRIGDLVMNKVSGTYHIVVAIGNGELSNWIMIDNCPDVYSRSYFKIVNENR